MRAGWRCLLVIVGCWGCAGDLDDPERFDFLLDGAMTNAPDAPPEAPECVTSLFETRCSTSTACHGAESLQLDLVSADVESRLIDVSSTSRDCGDSVYVPTDGSASLLLEKLGEQPPCGLRMPIGQPLEESEMMCVSAWVQAVAAAGGGGS